MHRHYGSFKLNLEHTLYIEEDFRFSTDVQVQHYSPSELVWKPHIAGYNYCHLVDQMHEIVRKNSKVCSINIHGPGGTVWQLVKRFSKCLPELDLRVNLTSHSSSHLKKELAKFDRLSFVRFTPDLATDFTLTVFATSSLRPEVSGPTLAYDPERRFEHAQGYYFMGSAIWRNA